MPHPKKKYHRWTRDPILDKSGKPVVIHLPTKNDLETFSILHPDRYHRLPTSFIVALKGTGYSYTQRRLEQLSRKPNYYLYRTPAQRPFIGNTRDQLYELDTRGGKELGQRIEIEDDPRQLAHRLMIDMTWANIELGMKEQGHQYIYPLQIFDSQAFPHPTRKEAYPFSIPVAYNISAKVGKRTINHNIKYGYTSDGIRGILYPNNDILFFQLEAERKKPVDRDITNADFPKQRSFLKTLYSIRHIMDNHLYQKRWGIERLLTLVVVPTQDRLETISKLIEREMGECPYILIKVIATLDDVEQPLKPDPTFYTEPWHRVGYPPFDISKP